MRRTPTLVALAAVIPTVTTATLLAPAQATTSHHHSKPLTHTLIATGLNNPRQLDAAAHDTLYIALAGNATDSTSGIARISHVDHVYNKPVTAKTFATGFFSVGDPDTGTFAVGMDGVSALGHGPVYAVTTSAPPCQVAQLPKPVQQQAGKLYRFDEHGKAKVVADIAAYEYAHNPDNGLVDEPNDCQGPIGKKPDLNSNPYAVLTLPDRVLVADAGGNTIYQYKHGHLSVWAVINGNGLIGKYQAVPTSLAVGRDGSIYVGTLVLGAFENKMTGQATIFHYSRSGKLLGKMAGFDTITGLTVAHDGSIFVSQLFTNKVVKVCWGHPKPSKTWSVPWPAGLALVDGKLYVSAWSVSDSNGGKTPMGTFEPGQVWRLNNAF